MTATPAPGTEQARPVFVTGLHALAPRTPGTPATTTPSTQQAPRLTRTQKLLIGFVAAGAVAIAGIGFAGSYTAVTALAYDKGFGPFSQFFTLGIDIGIGVFLALDLLLTWLRMPFPLLRQGAWLLTASTICFNAAASWPDALGVGMHAVIPLLFVIAVEAARHAIGRIANITADKHIESPPLIRWLLDPFGTFRIWRRQRMWQIRSYEDVITLERDALKFRRKLRASYGRNWRRKGQAHELLAVHFAKYGTPIAASLAEHDAEMAAANKRQEQTASDRQETAITAATGAGAGDNSSARNRQEERQEERQKPPVAAANSTASTAKKPGHTTSGGAKKDRQDTAGKTAKKATASASIRRSPEEWADVASPVFDSLRDELGTVPTGRQFANAIASAGLGDVSESTAKNIRQWVLAAPAKATR